MYASRKYVSARTFPRRRRLRSKKRETPIMVSTRLAPSSVKPARRRDGGMDSFRLKPTPPKPLLPERPLLPREPRDEVAGRRCYVCLIGK